MPWARYFDVLEKLEGNYGSGDTEARFKEENTKLVQQLLLDNKQGLGAIDWRIAKKMLVIKSVFQDDTVNINIQDLLKVIKKEFSKVTEHLLWEDSTKPNIKLTKEVADKLEKYFDLAQKDQGTLEKLETAIISGRFDKEDFALPGTVIMGEDGGTYLLINNTTLNKNTDVDVKEIITELVGEDYLKDKIAQKTKDTEKVEQITIGKGGFGTVRFGLSIFDSKSNPGDLICIKKTKNFDTLRDEAKRDIKPTQLEQVIDGTIGDYFTSDISGLIHAPKVYDLSFDTITLATNAMTLLVGSQYSFSCEDLTNVSIKGANIQNGIFYGTDLSGADLTNVNMTNVNLVKAKLTGTILQSVKLSILPDLLGHKGYMTSANFSADGKYVVSSSKDKTVKIWEAATGKCVTTLKGHEGHVTSANFSADGKYVVSSSKDKTVKIWEASNKKCITTLQGHTREVNSASFSPEGKYVVSASKDKTVKIWEASTSKCLVDLQGHTKSVYSASFSADGKYVVSSSDDNTVKIGMLQKVSAWQTFRGI